MEPASPPSLRGLWEEATLRDVKNAGPSASQGAE